MQRVFIKFKEYIEHIRHHTKGTTYQEYQWLVESWGAKEHHTEAKPPIAI